MSKKVLVVEDNEAIANILTKRLQMKGYEARHLVTGFEVLAMMAKEDEPGAIILDLMIPGRSGFELLNSIKVKWSGAKLFIFSAHPNYEYTIPSSLIEGFFLKSDGSDRLIQALERSLSEITNSN